MPSTSLPTESIVCSASSSRPVSPAQEALESTSPPDDTITPEEIAKIKSAQNRRKSSSWKGFNLKRQISKVDMKLKKTFGDGGGANPGESKEKGSSSIFYTMGDRPPLSPVEISPNTESNSTPTDTEQDKSDYLEELEKDIVKSLAELEYKDAIIPIETGRESRNSTSDNDSDPISPSQSNSAQNATATKSKKVEFSEEPEFSKSELATSPVEGGYMSRPSDLALHDPMNSSMPNNPDRPLPPPRGKKNRLLSVPNIKPYTVPPSVTAAVSSTKPEVRDLRGVNRSKLARSEGQPSFAGNLMRRFSKYQL